MNVYDCKLDNRGRLLLPKQIRHLFPTGARIIQSDSSSMVIEPLTKGIVVAEVDVVDNPKDLVGVAWRHNVAIRPVGIANGNFVIRCHGLYEDVKGLLDEWGYPKEEFEDYLI